MVGSISGEPISTLANSAYHLCDDISVGLKLLKSIVQKHVVCHYLVLIDPPLVTTKKAFIILYPIRQSSTKFENGVLYFGDLNKLRWIRLK